MRKPCWWLAGGNEEFICGRMSASSTLAAGHRREIGLYEAASASFLPGFSKGIMVDFFHMAGMLQLAKEELNIFVRKDKPFAPKFLRCKIEMLSGPRALDALALFMAFLTLSMVKIGGDSRLPFLTILIVFRILLSVLCMRTLPNILLNWVARIKGSMNFLLSNFMALFGGGFGLPLKDLMMRQRGAMLRLTSKFSMVSLQIDLFSLCMAWEILLLEFWISTERGSLARSSSRFFINSLTVLDKCGVNVFLRPLGIVVEAAWAMMLRKIISALGHGRLAA